MGTLQKTIQTHRKKIIKKSKGNGCPDDAPPFVDVYSMVRLHGRCVTYTSGLRSTST